MWLQDLVLASLIYGCALFFALRRFELEPWLVSGFYVLPAVFGGGLAALILCEQVAALHENGLARAAVFVLVAGSFGISPDVSLVVWWLARRTAYWCRQDTAGLTTYAQWSIAAVLLVYGVAFFLPLDQPVRKYGYDAYRTCFEMSLRALAGHELGRYAVLLALPWSANPALWVGLSFLIAGRWLAAVSAAAMALLFGFSIKLAATFAGTESSQTVLEEIQEAASSPAYYTWLGSMVLLLAAGLGGLILARRRSKG